MFGVWSPALRLNYLVSPSSNFSGNRPPFLLGATYSDLSRHQSSDSEWRPLGAERGTSGQRLRLNPQRGCRQINQPHSGGSTEFPAQLHAFIHLSSQQPLKPVHGQRSSFLQANKLRGSVFCGSHAAHLEGQSLVWEMVSNSGQSDTCFHLGLVLPISKMGTVVLTFTRLF